MINLNERAQEVHNANAKWWYDLETGECLVRNNGELQMLAISEIAEAMEGERKNLMDDHLPHRRMAEVEMADAYIRELDYAAGNDFAVNEIEFEFVQYANKAEMLYEICDIMCLITDYPEYLDDVIAAIKEYCRFWGYDLEGAYHDKMAYNAVRADHQKEARMAANGKKW